MRKSLLAFLLLIMLSGVVSAAPRIVVLPLQNEGKPQDSWYVLGLTDAIARMVNQANFGVGLGWRTVREGLLAESLGRKRELNDQDYENLLDRLSPDYYLRGSYLVEWSEELGEEDRYSVEIAALSWPREEELFHIRFTGTDLFAIEVEIYTELRLRMGEPLDDEGLELAKELITADASAYRWYCRGISTVGSSAQELGYLTEAVNRNEAFWIARRELARVYLEEDDVRHALSELLTVYREQPEEPWTLKYYGDILSALNEKEKSNRMYRRAGLVDEREWRLHLELGALLEEMGAITLAERSYDKLLLKDSRFYEAYRGLGAILLSRGEYHEALDILKRGRSLANDEAEYIFLLGQAYSYNGEQEEAIETFHRAVMLAPTNGEYAYELGYAYYRNRENVKADEWWREASLLGYSPEDPLAP